VVFEHKGTAVETIDVLDRVLDKGIVMDGSIRFALVEIDFVSVHARFLVASIETYVNPAEAIPVTSLLAGTPLSLARSAWNEVAMVPRYPSPMRFKRRTA
jgi:hypothetical protein